MGPLPRIRLLVASDDEDYVATLSDGLTSWQRDAIVGTARSAEQADLLVAEVAPDVVFIDVDLPGLDAPRTLSRLKQIDGAPIVVALARDDTAHARSEAFAAGADGFLAKTEPVERARELMASIRLHLRIPPDGTVTCRGAV